MDIVQCGTVLNINIYFVLKGIYILHDNEDFIKIDITYFRDTVMMLLALLDPDGTRQRCSRKLKRRIYRSKVIKLDNASLLNYNNNEGTKLFLAL